MKRSKKLLALVLAMVMAFSLMAVTAAAYSAEEHNHEHAVCCEDGGVMPLYEVLICPDCGKNAEVQKEDGRGRARIVCLNPECGYKSDWFNI